MHPKNAPGGKPEPASLGPEPKGHWIYSSRTNYAPIQIRIRIQMHLIKYKYRGIANNSIVRQQLWGSQCAWTSATATSLTFSRADSKHSSVHSFQSGGQFHRIFDHFHFSTYELSFLIFSPSSFICTFLSIIWRVPSCSLSLSLLHARLISLPWSSHHFS